jgi:dipeptidyl-peptidase 4
MTKSGARIANNFMMRILILGFLVLASTFSFAQKTELSLEDAVLKRFSDFYPKGPSQLQWISETDSYSFVSDTDPPELMVQGAVESSARSVVILADLSAALGEDEPLKRFPRISWTSSRTFVFRTQKAYKEYDVDAKSIQTLFEIPEDAEHVSMNEQRTAFAYILDSDLYIGKKDGKTVRVTSDGGEGIVYGQSVHRNEFGITGGMFWSPKGNKLAFYRMNESMVEDYPLVDISTLPASVNLIKYPMAGRTSHQVKLGVFNLNGDPLTFMNTEGAVDQYLTSIGWVPNESSIIIGILNRDQNHLKLNEYSAIDGRIMQSILEEKSEKYVEPEHAPRFIPGSETQFLWLSEKDGYQHIYLYDLKAGDERQITKGKWEVHSILGFDNSQNYLFVDGTGEITTAGKVPDHSFNGTQRYTYLVDFELGGHVLIDSTKGTHNGQLSPNSTYVLDQFTSASIPLEVSLFEANGKKVRTIHENENPLKDYAVGDPEFFTLSGANNQPLYGRLIKPSHFDPEKKYPVLIYVYGGPHAQLVQDRFLGAAPLWMYAFAEQGYLVATVDNRGSANRGLEFEQATFRQLGLEEMSDQKQLVDYLRSQTYVDANKLAVHGWSYGGFMTINMLLTFPGTFKAGIAGGPVCNWGLYEVMYTERYMDTPESNPDGYKNANLVERASLLEDDLLVIHGTEDNVVVWQHSQSFLKACVDNGKQLDYFVYPGHPHNVRGKDRYHLMEKVLDYAADRIGPGTK